MGASILVVDDSRIDRRLIEEKLRREGYEVAAAADGAEALARLDLHPVDVVVSDLLMPGLSGIELLSRIRDREQPPPVILLTGSAAGADVTAAFRAGAADYVVKERLTTDLLPSVERIFERLDEERRRRQSDQWLVGQRMTFSLPSDRAQVCPLVRTLCRLGMQFGAYGEQDEIRICVALEEALLNAVIHGNLEVSSELRETGGSEFDDLIAERQRQPQYNRRRVRVDCEATSMLAAFRIADEGPGFNVSQLPDPRDEDRIALASGRGILMMRAFMDEVFYNDRGNVVTLVKRRPATEPQSGRSAPATQESPAVELATAG